MSSLTPSRRQRVGLYSGTLINDLMATVESAEQAVSRPIEKNHGGKPCAAAANSQPKQFAEPFGLRPADWNLALLLIIHAQLVRTLEPGHDFANTVDVHQVGTVS